MKILLLMLMLVSCIESENTVSNVPGQDEVPQVSTGGAEASAVSIVSTGSLSSRNGYFSTGDVTLFFNSDTGMYSLVVENLGSSNGPDVRVYLSEDSRASSFNNLGGLTSTQGTIRYDFPEDDFDPAQNILLIWCADINESFGEAQLN